MNQLIPADRHRVKYAAWGIVLLTLVHLCWLQSRPGSELHRICGAATKPSANRPTRVPDDPFDRLASQPGDGNIVLKLAGYARTNPTVENSLGYFYYRASYAFYPRRVYVAPADKIINDGGDIMQAEFDPGPKWLQDHNVRFALTFGNDHAGGETPQLESLRPEGGPAGTQTNSAGGN